MPDDAEFNNLLNEEYANRAQLGVVKGIDADKDKAAESTAIEKDTGYDAQVIYGNFDDFNRNRKSNLAQGLVEKDDWLLQYANSHPMASNVSKDDWGTLSEVSDTIKQHPWLAAGMGPLPYAVLKSLPDIMDNVKAGLKTISEIGVRGTGTRAQIAKEALEHFDEREKIFPHADPAAWRKALEQEAQGRSTDIFEAAYGAGQVVMAPLIGTIQANLTKPLAELDPSNPWLQREFTEPLLMLAGSFFGMKGDIAGMIEPKALNAKLDRIRDTVDRVDPYIRNRENIPVGADPAVDALNGVDSQAKMKILDAIMKADSKSETRELSPELYNNFTKLQHSDTSIYLRWNAVKALYGDKVPMPDDGMLGWVPDIEKQMKSSALTGEDIEIPLADWRAKVDPEINKQLHDDILFEGGITTREAKEVPKPETAEVSTAGEETIPGLTQELDRPYKLSKTEPGEFKVLNEGGGEVGQVKVAETDNGKTLLVDWRGPSDVAGLRTLLNQLKKEYPNADTVTGPKVPGMVALEKALQGTKIEANVPFRFREHEIDVAKRAAGLEPLSEIEGKPLIQPLEAAGPTFEPGVLLPKAAYTKLMRAMDAVRDSAAKKMFDDATREERKKQTPEWKANFAKMREQVANEIGNRPDFRTSAFFRNGMFMGQDTHYMPKLDPKFLTPQQRRGLPNQWIKTGGMNPDELAGSFGYSSGRDMIDKMVEFEQRRGKLQPKQFVDSMIDNETTRRMEQQYGKLSENVAKAAREAIVVKEQFDALHEEYIRLGELAGQQLPLSKENIQANAKADFKAQTSSKVSLMKYTTELGRSGRATHDAYLKKDYIEAFKARQEQLHIFAKAQLAKEFEKQQESLGNNLKKFAKGVTEGIREVVPGVANPYTEWVQKIMYQIKRPPRRSIQNLDENIAKRDEKTLREFVDAKNNIGLPEGVLDYEVDLNQNIPVADFLMDPAWTKDLKDTTVGEFQDIDNAIRALAKLGRDEFKWIKEGQAKDLGDLKSSLISYLEKLGVKKQYAPGKGPGFWRTGNAMLLQMEFLFNRWGGGGDPRLNPFMQTFAFPFARAEGEFTRDIVQTSKKMIDIWNKYKGPRGYLKEKLDNDVFYHPQGLKKDSTGKWQVPVGGSEWLPMTRANLRAVLLNMGNEGNLRWLAEGYHTTPDKIIQWADRHATKNDWLWAQEIGGIFKDIQEGSDRMTREMSDVTVEKIPLGKVPTQAAGELDGWYYPIVYDRSMQGGKPTKIERAPPVKPVTDASWQKRRTSPQGPLSLSIDPLASQISRRLRDNNFRQVVHESSKILLDKEFKGAVSRYSGPHHADLFEPYLRDIAGMNGFTSAAEASMERTMTFYLQNTISTMIGYKVGTVLKHGATAFVQSWAEVGVFAPDFYKSAASLYMTNHITQKSNLDFMLHGGQVGDLDWKGSAELQRRGRHWDQTIGGATDIQLGKMNWRERFAHWASKPVAFSDMISSTILWHARYDKVMKEGQANGLSLERAHTEAVDLADYAIRRTHGSTAITARPALMRNKNAFVRSIASLYGFFNHIYNRYYEMAWMAKGLPGKMQKGDQTYKQDIQALASGAIFYGVLPGMIEEAVASWLLQSEKQEEEYTPWEFFKNGLVHTTAGSIPIVRDAVNAVQMGRDPSVGIFSSPIKAITDLARDLDPSREHIRPGAVVHHGLNLLNISTGLGTPDQVNRWLGFMADTMAGEEDPSTMTGEEWYRAIRTGGSAKPRR